MENPDSEREPIFVEEQVNPVTYRFETKNKKKLMEIKNKHLIRRA